LIDYLVDLIAPRPGVEPATFRSRVRRSTTATVKTNTVETQRLAESGFRFDVIISRWRPRRHFT